MLAPVTSVAQILAFKTSDGRQLARNWGSIRATSGSGQTVYDPPRVHRARDIYVPPGSPIYAPVGGVWQGWGTSNEDGSTSMGWVGKILGDDGIYWRFIHLGTGGKIALSKGQRIEQGTRIGFTVDHKLGRSDSHLHLDAARGGKACSKGGTCIDPVEALGARGWNIMLTGNDGGVAAGGGAGFVLKVIGAAALGGALFVGWRRFMIGRAPRLPA